MPPTFLLKYCLKVRATVHVSFNRNIFLVPRSAPRKSPSYSSSHVIASSVRANFFFQPSFLTLSKKKRSVSFCSRKFEDYNGGVMDGTRRASEIVKRSAGSIVRLVRSSRSRETRYMYSFAWLYNVSWEGSLVSLCVHTCRDSCACMRMYP